MALYAHYRSIGMSDTEATHTINMQDDSLRWQIACICGELGAGWAAMVVLTDDINQGECPEYMRHENG